MMPPYITSPKEPVTIPTIADCLPPTRPGFFLICDSATVPSTIATMAGIGPRHAMLRIPTIIEAVAKLLFSGCAYIGGGGGCHFGTLRGSGTADANGADAGSFKGRFKVASRSGFGGGASDKLITVGGGSDAAGSSTSVVPSCVQKLSQSSGKVSLQVGQRFIR